MSAAAPAVRRADTDTIVAIATPPGAGAIGVIRVSGPSARECVLPLLQAVGGQEIAVARPRALHRVRVVDPARRAPSSTTRSWCSCPVLIPTPART